MFREKFLKTTCFMGPELVCLFDVFVQTHVKNCIQDTPYIPLRCILKEILPYHIVKQDHIGKKKKSYTFTDNMHLNCAPFE